MALASLNPTPANSIEHYLEERLANALGCETRVVRDCDNLFDLGMDSFAFMEMIADIENRFTIEFTETELLSGEFKNLRQMVSLVGRKLGDA